MCREIALDSQKDDQNSEIFINRTKVKQAIYPFSQKKKSILYDIDVGKKYLLSDLKIKAFGKSKKKLQRTFQFNSS